MTTESAPLIFSAPANSRARLASLRRLALGTSSVIAIAAILRDVGRATG